MPQTILVTGATGFAGSHVLEELTRIGHHELHIIAACRDRRKLIPEFDGEVREGDLRDPHYLDHLLVGVNIVCHCAAWTSMWGHARQSRKLFLEPGLKLIDKALEWKVTRFVFISTTSAASPDQCAEPQSPGIHRHYWPHLSNLVKIETRMQDYAFRGMSMVNLRLGLFAGHRYGLGLLPILLPRLKSRLMPWVAGGRASLPIISGEDIGQAIMRAALAPGLSPYESFNIVGPEIPATREVVTWICDTYGYTRPFYSVPFFAAFAYAFVMEKLSLLISADPRITRGIVHMLEETGANNEKASRLLGYAPEIHWKEALRLQVEEMKKNDFKNMKMTVAVKPMSSIDDDGKNI